MSTFPDSRQKSNHPRFGIVMPKNPHLRTTAAAGLLMLAVLMLAAPVSAHEGGGGSRIRIHDAIVGRYLVRAATSPIPPRVDQLWIEIRILAAENLEPAEDCVVIIDATPAGSGETISTSAGPEDGEGSDYLAHLEIPHAGIWEIAIEIDGPLGEARLAFLERISPRNPIGGWLAAGAPVMGIGGLVALFLWLNRRSTREA